MTIFDLFKFKIKRDLIRFFKILLSKKVLIFFRLIYKLSNLCEQVFYFGAQLTAVCSVAIRNPDTTILHTISRIL